MRSDNAVDSVQYYLDITPEVCPMTFVRTRLLVERMAAGETAEVRLKGAEPLENVPASLTELGHEVLSMAPEDPAAAGPDDIWRLRVKKAG